jgi:hypothetical protein
MLFGTFCNPEVNAPRREQGFYRGASARLVDMLLFRDVSRDVSGSPTLTTEKQS